MRKYLILSGICSLLYSSACAGDGDYAVSKIPAALLKHANAVIRRNETRFEIINTRETITYEHYVITILNENADELADFEEYHNKYQDINSIDGILYDAAGNQLKRVKKKDIQDLSGVSDENLFDDTRVKHHNFYYRVYPYTIEYSVEIDNSSTLFFPSWFRQVNESTSVEQSSMSIVCSPDYKFRYKDFGYSGEPVVTTEKDKKVSSWSVKNMQAFAGESFAPRWHDITTTVIYGTTDFQVDDYKGSMNTWQDFGKFVYALKQGRDQLPDNVKKDVHRLADNISDPASKVAALYEYMQKNTRYVGIQLGIGGWQPFDANFVASKGYGDCKALSNYMFSLLKEEGIRSCYTVIRSGRTNNYITVDFPSQQFNHVILCVPMKDTMWLECTSQDLPAGYLSDFTADRYALLVDESGGKLVHTPKYGLSQNLQVRHVNAKLEEDGTIKIQAKTKYEALEQGQIHAMINALSKDKVKEYLHEELNFATYDVDNFEYKEEKSIIPSINESLDITVSNYASITGKRLFIVPNIMTRSNQKLTPDTARKYPVELAAEFRDEDSAEIDLPKGYERESAPADVNISTRFGKYSSRTLLKDNKVYYYRSFERYSGEFKPGEYSDLVKFYEDIYKADRARIVLVKNEQQQDTPKKAF